MKKTLFILIVSLISISTIITACGNKSNISNINNLTDKNPKEISTNDLKVENLGAEEKFDKVKDIKIVVGSTKVLDLLELLGYKNIVAVPSEAISSYENAVDIGSEVGPNVEVINQFFGDWGKDVIFLTDSSIEYNQEFMDKIKLKYTVLPLETNEDKKVSLYGMGTDLGLEKTADELVKSLDKE